MTTLADGLRRDQPAGFWRRMCAGVFDVVFLMTAALVLLLEILVAVPVATRSSLGCVRYRRNRSAMDCAGVGVVRNVRDSPARPLLHPH